MGLSLLSVQASLDPQLTPWPRTVVRAPGLVWDRRLESAVAKQLPSETHHYTERGFSVEHRVVL